MSSEWWYRIGELYSVNNGSRHTVIKNCFIGVSALYPHLPCATTLYCDVIVIFIVFQ